MGPTILLGGGLRVGGQGLNMKMVKIVRIVKWQLTDNRPLSHSLIQILRVGYKISWPTFLEPYSVWTLLLQAIFDRADTDVDDNWEQEG